MPSWSSTRHYAALRAEAAKTAGTDPNRVSFSVTVRIARAHAATRAAGHSQARRDAITDITDIIADVLSARRDHHCERVKKPSRNTFAAKERAETPPATRATYTITIMKGPYRQPAFLKSLALQVKGTFSYERLAQANSRRKPRG